jgi:hypothetical protein
VQKSAPLGWASGRVAKALATAPLLLSRADFQPDLFPFSVVPNFRSFVKIIVKD